MSVVDLFVMVASLYFMSAIGLGAYFFTDMRPKNLIRLFVCLWFVFYVEVVTIVFSHWN